MNAATTNASPVNALRNAEAGLIAAVNAAADALDLIGAGSLDAAMARLKESAEMAKRRLSEAKANLTATVAGVTLDAEDFAAGLLADLEMPTAVVDPVAPTASAAPTVPANRLAAYPLPEPSANGHAETTVVSPPDAEEVIDLTGPVPPVETPDMPVATPGVASDAMEGAGEAEVGCEDSGDSDAKGKPAGNPSRKTAGKGSRRKK